MGGGGGGLKAPTASKDHVIGSIQTKIAMGMIKTIKIEIITSYDVRKFAVLYLLAAYMDIVKTSGKR